MSTQNQNTDTAPDTTGAELATTNAAIVDPFDAFRAAVSKAIAPSMKTVVEKSMGGWEALHGKSAADRVADATTRMIGGNVASTMIAETRISIAAKLFAQAVSEESVIGKAGVYKSDSEWLARVNAALPVGEDGKRDAYSLPTMRMYAKLYKASERWAKEYKLEFAKDDGLYRSMGTTVCGRLAELETGGGLDKAEFGKLIDLCRNGGEVKIGDKVENVPAAAPRSSKSVDNCYSALCESLGKVMVLPAVKEKTTRAAGGATNQQAGNENTTNTTLDDAEGTADAPLKTQPDSAEMMTRRVATVNASIEVVAITLANMAAAYVTAENAKHESVKAAYDEAVKLIANPFAGNMWQAAVAEARENAKKLQTAVNEFAVLCVIDAIKWGATIPNRVKYIDGKTTTEIDVTPDHTAEANKRITDANKPTSNKPTSNK